MILSGNCKCCQVQFPSDSSLNFLVFVETETYFELTNERLQFMKKAKKNEIVLLFSRMYLFIWRMYKTNHHNRNLPSHSLLSTVALTEGVRNILKSVTKKQQTSVSYFWIYTLQITHKKSHIHAKQNRAKQWINNRNLNGRP